MLVPALFLALHQGVEIDTEWTRDWPGTGGTAFETIESAFLDADHLADLAVLRDRSLSIYTNPGAFASYDVVDTDVDAMAILPDCLPPLPGGTATEGVLVSGTAGLRLHTWTGSAYQSSLLSGDALWKNASGIWVISSDPIQESDDWTIFGVSADGSTLMRATSEGGTFSSVSSALLASPLVEIETFDYDGNGSQELAFLCEDCLLLTSWDAAQLISSVPATADGESLEVLVAGGAEFLAWERKLIATNEYEVLTFNSTHATALPKTSTPASSLRAAAYLGGSRDCLVRASSTSAEAEVHRLVFEEGVLVFDEGIVKSFGKDCGDVMVPAVASAILDVEGDGDLDIALLHEDTTSKLRFWINRLEFEEGQRYRMWSYEMTANEFSIPMEPATGLYSVASGTVRVDVYLQPNDTAPVGSTPVFQSSWSHSGSEHTLVIPHDPAWGDNYSLWIYTTLDEEAGGQVVHTYPTRLNRVARQAARSVALDQEYYQPTAREILNAQGISPPEPDDYSGSNRGTGAGQP